MSDIINCLILKQYLPDDFVYKGINDTKNEPPFVAEFKHLWDNILVNKINIQRINQKKFVCGFFR